MKKNVLTGLLALLLMPFPLIIIGQTNTSAQSPAPVKRSDTAACGNLEYGGQTYHTVMIGSQCDCCFPYLANRHR